MDTISDPNKGKGEYHELTNTSSAVKQHSSYSCMHSSPEGHRTNKKEVKYMECLKNHAAALGKHATDGCGEFMPGGEEGTIEALKCAACNCHRNFHEKGTQGECYCQCYHRQSVLNTAGTDLTSSHHHHQHNGRLGQEILSFHTNARMHQVEMTMSTKKLEQIEGGDHVETRPYEVGRKRYRTKFSQEQKEKMWSFAEKVGWKMQKSDDSTVSHFCQEVGITRRVLKVWMHNNKQRLARKSTLPPIWSAEFNSPSFLHYMHFSWKINQWDIWIFKNQMEWSLLISFLLKNQNQPA